MNMDLHRQRAYSAWPILVEAAKSKSPLTYRQLSDAIGVHWRVANLYLGVIQKYCKDKELPPLQALAVNGRTGLPGSGYYGSSNDKKAHSAALEKVSYHEWGKEIPDFSRVIL